MAVGWRKGNVTQHPLTECVRVNESHSGGPLCWMGRHLSPRADILLPLQSIISGMVKCDELGTLLTLSLPLPLSGGAVPPPLRSGYPRRPSTITLGWWMYIQMGGHLFL